ncbi:hypothetical protein DMC30DRAFT_418305 [Rhodotorula diobovata]|uniref:Beta-lactamase-like protein n=1 Tax=Rhodotorula diobovata TaxID=5288 RepID=A0A5C5FRY6_9BASI|nr:hypothetical protein DMC30DRAFT_418305 [Rhodotorula diobovata]
MSSVNAPAPPSKELVIRKLDSSTTIFSLPFARGGVVPFGGRSTAIKLHDGSVWLAASHPLDPATLETLTALGPVKHIVQFDQEHGMFTGQYADAFPDAKLYFPIGGLHKWEKKRPLPPNYAVFEHGAHEADPFEETTGGEIRSASFVKGHINQDIAFLHAPTKTLIEADLLLNLPPTEQYSRSSSRSSLPFLSNMMKPGSTAHKRFLHHLASTDKKEMADAARKVAGWDFDRIIPCHGDVIETGGKKAWTDTYAWFLEGN